MDVFIGVMMELVNKVRRFLTRSLEQVKMDLIKTYQELPNPATYRIHSKHQIPVQESFVLISKRSLLKNVK